jgi:hypothetical protein
MRRQAFSAPAPGPGFRWPAKACGLPISSIRPLPARASVGAGQRIEDSQKTPRGLLTKKSPERRLFLSGVLAAPGLQLPVASHAGCVLKVMQSAPAPLQPRRAAMLFLPPLAVRAATPASWLAASLACSSHCNASM